MNGSLVRSFILTVVLALTTVSALPAAQGGTVPTPESIFAQAKGVWRGRTGPSFVRYSLLERYTWRNRVHDNWWRGAYRDRDSAISLHRIIVPEEEAARLHGTSIGINFRIHHGAAHADTLDTNADADAFPILDPVVAPDASFGLSRAEGEANLLGSERDGAGSASVHPSPAPSAATPAAEFATDRPLRELARVEAVARDYAIAYAGIDRIRDEDAYHLTLVPLREPRTYRLRELWVATKNYETLKLAVDGLFSGRPYDDARWTVTFVDFGGLAYVQQIRADEVLRFGLDRYVGDLEYDFVDYSFPQTMPPLEFDRLL